MVSANASAMSEVVHKCIPCGKVFKSVEKVEEHKGAKKHKKREKEYRMERQGKEETSMFVSIS